MEYELDYYPELRWYVRILSDPVKSCVPEWTLATTRQAPAMKLDEVPEDEFNYLGSRNEIIQKWIAEE